MITLFKQQDALVYALSAQPLDKNFNKMAACRPLAMSTLFAGLIPKPGAGYVRLQQALLRLAYEESCIVEGKLDLLQIVKHGTVTQNPFLVWLNQTRIQSTAFAFQWKRMGETFKQNRLTSFAKQYDDLYAYITIWMLI